MKRFYAQIIAVLVVVICVGALWAQDTGEVYRIKPGDQLSVYVHENNDLTMTINVLPDGTISYPLVGSLYVQGLTTTGLQNILAEKLQLFLQKPVVVVTIASETLYKVFVMGEVKMPNAFPFQEGRRLTDYLAQAGGPGPEANLKKCTVFSEDPTIPRRVINLNDIFQDGDRTLDIKLQPYDTILLERRSGFIVTEWQEIAQVFAIITGVATIAILAQRR